MNILQMMGSCRDGFERNSGRLWHAVPDDCWKAVCGAEPGRRSAGWSNRIGSEVTCTRCARRLLKEPKP